MFSSFFYVSFCKLLVGEEPLLNKMSEMKAQQCVLI